MAYKSYFAEDTSTTATPKKSSGYVSYFGNKVQADSQPVKTQASAVPKKQVETPKKYESLFNKVKRVANDNIVKPTVETVEKSANTVAAGAGSTAGLAVAGAQAVAGKREAAKKTIASTNKNADAILDKGLGGKGGYLNSKQANSRGGGAKSLKEDFIKPTTKAVSEVAPLVVPVGKTAKGANLLVKVAKGAGENAAVGAGSSAAAQVADNGKVSAKETAKAAAIAGIFGGVTPIGGKVVSKASNKAARDLVRNTRNNTLLDIARKTPEPEATPAPGDVVRPGKLPQPARPAKNPDGTTQQIVATPEHHKAVTDLIARAQTEHPVFQQTMQGISKELGLKYKGGPVKDATRALQKVMDDYGGDPTRLKDTVRGTIEVPDHSKAGFQAVIDKIKETYPEATVKDGYKNYKNGYVDVKVNVKTPGGHMGEIILATPEMLEAKKRLGGHELYSIVRDTTKPDAERKAANEQMQVLYDNAHASANNRLASSSGIPSETKAAKATAGETGSPAPSRTAGTRLEAPVATTVSSTKPLSEGRTASTTSSSVTKKRGVVDSSIPSTVAEKTPEVKHKSNIKSSAGKDGSSRVFERLQAEHPESLTGDLKYNKINLQKDAEKAAALVIKDKQQAFRVAMGEEALPDQTSTGVNIALAEKALDEGNHELYAKLTRSRSLEQTRRGQELVAEKGSVTDNSTARYVKELLATRMDKVSKKYLSDLDAEQKKATPAKQAAMIIDKEVAKLQQKVRAKKLDTKTALQMLDRMECLT